ncbi:MAG: hypothetical protein QOF51_1001 [Chloroflexota bacterium]|jgi:hypothetical protein|nr:hypothetical protein [Chloroflexota bacterium]
MDDSYLTRNAAELRRLHELVGRLADADCAVSLGGGWTVGVALAHLAFWDRAAVILLDEWERTGFQDPPFFDADEVNEAGLYSWLLIPPVAVRREVLVAADAVDARVVRVPIALADVIEAAGRLRVLDRSVHRGEHVDHITRVLGRE